MAKAPVENLTGLLDTLCGLVDCGRPGTDIETVEVRAVLGAIGRRAYGPLLLGLGLFSLSPLTLLPGANVATALLIGLVALQLMVGAPRPWMPAPLLNATLSRQLLLKSIDLMRPWAARVDRVLRPRLTFLTRAPLVSVVGLVVLAVAVITVPLSFVPLGPVVPGLAVVVLGLGLVAKDGLVMLVGAGVVVGAGFLAQDAVGVFMGIVGPWLDGLR
jgi:hypothetical protein